MNLLSKKYLLGIIYLFLFVTNQGHTSVDKCHEVCFPEKIYSSCTVKTRSLSLEEQAQCDKMTAACKSCSEEKATVIKKVEEECNDVCHTEQLIQCHQQIDTLTVENKANCNKLAEQCTHCTEEKKSHPQKTMSQCSDHCDTEHLIQCHKQFETLSVEDKASCTRLEMECQNCSAP